jgi:hypothetical protein
VEEWPPLPNDNTIKHILTTLLEDEKQVNLDNKGPIYLDSQWDFRTQSSLWKMGKENQ